MRDFCILRNCGGTKSDSTLALPSCPDRPFDGDDKRYTARFDQSDQVRRLYANLPDRQLGRTLKLSARNKLKGKITLVEEGLITARVKLDLGNGNVVTAIISREAIEDLHLKVGDVAYAVIKSTEIMIGVD